MPRKKRIWYPGATYHVMSRGNRRMAIFTESYDYVLFLTYMKMLKEKCGFKIHSICLMTNHFHIAIETQDVELWKIMQKLLSIYAEEFNHLHGFTPKFDIFSGHRGRRVAGKVKMLRHFAFPFCSVKGYKSVHIEVSPCQELKMRGTVKDREVFSFGKNNNQMLFLPKSYFIM